MKTAIVVLAAIFAALAGCSREPETDLVIGKQEIRNIYGITYNKVDPGRCIIDYGGSTVNGTNYPEHELVRCGKERTLEDTAGEMWVKLSCPGARRRCTLVEVHVAPLKLEAPRQPAEKRDAP